MTRITRSRGVRAGLVAALVALPIGAIAGNSLLQTSAVHADERNAEESAPAATAVDVDSPPSNVVIPVPDETLRALEGAPGMKLPESMAACLPEVPDGYMIRGADLFSGPECRSAQEQRHHEIGDAPPPASLVDRCRRDLASDPSCGVVLAMADGDLKPGSYTDQALQDAVEAAGYSWAPAR